MVRNSHWKLPVVPGFAPSSSCLCLKTGAAALSLKELQ